MKGGENEQNLGQVRQINLGKIPCPPIIFYSLICTFVHLNLIAGDSVELRGLGVTARGWLLHSEIGWINAQEGKPQCVLDFFEMFELFDKVRN